ncbi:g12974 [Coccomyxa viridis]|uniref:G12974 protein n=1 Tax=Coccomyxa viridis TaxID=1274662 RepID=A0ABP1GH83_9CHLO
MILFAWPKSDGSLETYSGGQIYTPNAVAPPAVGPDEMLAVAWFGKEKVEVIRAKKPHIIEPTDAILKVTSTCICGSDLHLYLGFVPGIEPEDILGHEVRQLFISSKRLGLHTLSGLHYSWASWRKSARDVKKVKKGERYVCCFDIGCGECFYCQRQLFSCCMRSNPSNMTCGLYGHKLGGFYGYSHITGGYPGGQAQYARVLWADVNLLKVPEGMEDNKVVLLSDVMPTGWHGATLANVQKGNRVAVWGCGPVGQLAVHSALVKGAEKVANVDSVQYRMDYVKKWLPKVQTIDFSKVHVAEALHNFFGTTTAPDCSIECVGVHCTKSWRHELELMAGAETGPSDTINEILFSTRKGGKIGVIGAYVGFCDHYNLGGFMEKHLHMAGGQTPCQKYWPQLLKMIQEGMLTPWKRPAKSPPLGVERMM